MVKKYSLDERDKLDALMESFSSLQEVEKINKLEDLAKQEPEFSGVHYKLGMIYYDNNKYDDAIKHFDVVNKIDPSNYSAFELLARSYGFKNDKDNTLKAIKEMYDAEERIRKEKATSAFKEPFYGKPASEIFWDPAEYNVFKKYHNDPSFIAICKKPAVAPAGLEVLYNAAKNEELNTVLKEGEKVLKKAKDQLSVLHPMYYALKLINSDLDEHGKANLYLYDKKKTVDDYKEYLNKIEVQINTLKSQGAISSAFIDYMGDKVANYIK
jgi:uncharacterized protein HemY